MLASPGYTQLGDMEGVDGDECVVSQLLHCTSARVFPGLKT